MIQISIEPFLWCSTFHGVCHMVFHSVRIITTGCEILQSRWWMLHVWRTTLSEAGEQLSATSLVINWFILKTGSQGKSIKTHLTILSKWDIQGYVTCWYYRNKIQICTNIESSNEDTERSVHHPDCSWSAFYFFNHQVLKNKTMCESFESCYIYFEKWSLDDELRRLVAWGRCCSVVWW